MESIKKIFQKLNNENIKYCHWKSIDRLDEAYRGETDFDILVDLADAEKFINILFEFNAKKVAPRAWMIYPNMEDYLIFIDNKIYHFHIHYKLIMGRKNLKEYWIPLEKFYLENRVYNEKFNTFVVEPHIDIIVLIFRKIEKLGIKSKIKIFIKNIDLKCKEIEFLKQKINKKSLYEILEKIDKSLNANGKIKNEILKIYDNDFILTKKSYFAIYNFLKKYRIYSNLEVLFLPKIRFILNTYSAMFSRNNAKHFVKSGIAIALVGADGSGKTTVADNLVKKLRYKLSAKKYYLGCNKRSYSYKAKMLVFLSYFFRVFKKFNNINFFKNIHYIGILIAEYACLVDRRSLYNKAFKDIAKGMIIIFERFPLKNTIDYPVCFIKEFEIKNKFTIVMFLENYLKKEYNKIKSPENYTFWINAPVELIISRREMNEKTKEKVARKYKLVEKYAKENNLIILDAHKRVDELVNEIIDRIFKV